MNVRDILEKLKQCADPTAAEGMARVAITGNRVYGVKIPVLRKLAKDIGKNHDLARELWRIDSRETRILAAFVDDPKRVTEEQMESWVVDFDSWEVCDQCVMSLFRATPLAWEKAAAWSERDGEFVKRAGFALMASLASGDRKAGDDRFEAFLPIIEREAGDNRNFVKKAVNWALRQIGKRNTRLNTAAVETARRIGKQESKSARWIAADALRELESEAVRERLAAKERPRRQ